MKEKKRPTKANESTQNASSDPQLAHLVGQLLVATGSTPSEAPQPAPDPAAAASSGGEWSAAEMAMVARTMAELPTEVGVICNGVPGVLLPAQSLGVRCSCKACTTKQPDVNKRPIFAPNEFEKHCGKAAQKKWRASIRVAPGGAAEVGSNLSGGMPMGKWLDLKGVSVSRTGLEFFGHPLNTFSSTGAKLKAAGGGGGGAGGEPSVVTLRKRRGTSRRHSYNEDDEDEDDDDGNENDEEDDKIEEEEEEEGEEDGGPSHYRAPASRVTVPRVTSTSHGFVPASLQPWEDEARGRYQPVR